jgi:sulfite reductase (ferredoxin)
MFYIIPPTLPQEIDHLESLINQTLRGELEPSALKAHRVPFGVYEQRKDNTYMVRIRCTGGTLTPGQLRVIAQLSQQYGAHSLHITTRQEIQIHDVALENISPTIRRLLAAGLVTRGGGGNTVRNILISPESGVDPLEVFDITPYALALTSRLINEPDSWLLPRKFKISFSKSSADTAFATFNDLGFIAARKDEAQGFMVYMAGGMGSNPQTGHMVHEFLPESDVCFVAEALKRVFDKYGNRKNWNPSWSWIKFPISV